MVVGEAMWRSGGDEGGVAGAHQGSPAVNEDGGLSAQDRYRFVEIMGVAGQPGVGSEGRGAHPQTFGAAVVAGENNGASESQIQDILTKMEAVPVDASPDPAGFVDADVAFHRAILRATNTHSHSRRCRPYTVSCVSGWK